MLSGVCDNRLMAVVSRVENAIATLPVTTADHTKPGDMRSTYLNHIDHTDCDYLKGGGLCL